MAITHQFSKSAQSTERRDQEEGIQRNRLRLAVVVFAMVILFFNNTELVLVGLILGNK